MELEQQIARLMAAMAKAGQGGNPSSTPSNLWERGYRRGYNGGSTPHVQTLTMVEVALDRPPKPAAYLQGVGQGARELGAIARVIRGLAQGERAQLIGRTQMPSNALGARGGATWQGNALPLHQL